MRLAFIGLLAAALTGCTYITVYQGQGGNGGGGESEPAPRQDAARIERKVPVCLLDECADDLAACASEARSSMAQKLKALGNPIKLVSGVLLNGAPRAFYATVSIRGSEADWQSIWSDIGCVSPRGPVLDARRNQCRHYMAQWIEVMKPGLVARLEADTDFQAVCLRNTP